MKIRIGTRGSKLALWQANYVLERIEATFPHHKCELVVMKTKGDKILDSPLSKIGGKGLFVKEIEEALLAGRVDLAVHSLKDVPSELPDGLEIGAVPEREEPWDLIATKRREDLQELPHGARVGTSSLRRQAQLLAARPDLEIKPLRGNLDTRFRKLMEEDLDAIVVALAGVKRLGSAIDGHVRVLTAQECLPAIGQGALAVEIREGDLGDEMAALHHEETAVCVEAERSFLRRIGGSCQVPVAALGAMRDEGLVLEGLIASPDGERVYRKEIAGTPQRACELGEKLAHMLLGMGGRQVMEEIL